MNIEKLCQLVEKEKDELFALLSQLIKINSENFGSYGNEEACARYIHSLCEGMGLKSDLYSPLSLENFEENPDYFPGRGLENRYNVSAVWQGDENINELMLMGHSNNQANAFLKNEPAARCSGFFNVRTRRR